MWRRMSSRPEPAMLSKSRDQNLNIYSVSAIAAGVGMLALVAPAEGKVVITRKTIPIPANSVVGIDLNHDGIADFEFSFTSGGSICGFDASLRVKMPARNSVIVTLKYHSTGFASALVRGAKIGPSANFNGSTADAPIEHVDFAYCESSSRNQHDGQWTNNPPNRYVGVKFLIHGTTHYGWIRLILDFPAKFGPTPSAKITAYAYETVANKPISAGNVPSTAIQPNAQLDVKLGQPSLGMLALGADGLELWRREESLISN